VNGLPSVYALIRAVEASIPCLTDWCHCTGYGEAFARDFRALALCLDALDECAKENTEAGIQSLGSDAWPEAKALVQRRKGEPR